MGKKKKKLRKNELVIRANKHTHTHWEKVSSQKSRDTLQFSKTFSFSLATDSDKWGSARALTRGREQSRKETITNKNRERRLDPSSHRLKLKSLALTTHDTRESEFSPTRVARAFSPSLLRAPRVTEQIDYCSRARVHFTHTLTHIHTQYVNYMKKQWLRILNRG